MPKKGFFLNYGGPGGMWHSSTPSTFQFLDQECKAFYGPPTRTVNFVRQGLQIKVLTYGIHRALFVELPNNASATTKKLYQQLQEESFDCCDKEYGLLSNNCVTAVTTLLHKLDPTLVPEYLVLPWTLDAILKRSLALQSEVGFLKPFFEIYDQRTNQQNYFSFMSQRSRFRALKSLQEVIYNAYYGQTQEREKTKSSLLELNWVIEDEQGVLHPTQKAPRDFSFGLLAFNYDYQAVTMLKMIVTMEEVEQTIITTIFQDNPDFLTASERVKKNFMLSNPPVFEKIITQITDWQLEHPNDSPDISIVESDKDDPNDSGFFNG